MALPLRYITILGSTGSIGTQTLDVVQRLGDAYRINFLTCNTRVDDLIQQVRRFRPYGVAIRDEHAWKRFKAECSDFTGPVLCGEVGLCEAAAYAKNTIVMSAMVGFSGVVPTMAAVEAGHIVGLANKETLVSAGSIIMPAAQQHGSTILAVDSEHSAIAQCLVGEQLHQVHKLVITASGGPFRTMSDADFAAITPEQALRHPNWSMGSKITIDSATLMNKGFEVIEAHWLFGLSADSIDVVVHPQSIVHSLVEFVDGSVKAQLGLPSMLIPIQYALTYPERKPLDVPRMDLAAIGTLTFERPNLQRFPCLRIAYDVLRAGGTNACVANAANEVAVQAFLERRLDFIGIPNVIEKTLVHMEALSQPSLADIVELDGHARRYAESCILSKN